MKYARQFWSNHTANYLLSADLDIQEYFGSRRARTEGIIHDEHGEKQVADSSSLTFRLTNSLLAPAIYTDHTLTYKLIERINSIALSINNFDQQCLDLLLGAVLNDHGHPPQRALDIYQHLLSHGYDQAVRLVIVEPSSQCDATLNTWLVIDSLQNDLDFEALPYPWGDVTQRLHILVNGSSMEITENLFSALIHLRDLRAPRVLWTDQICINQADLSERSHQVGLIGMVFSRAQRAIAWMGEGSESSHLTMQRLAGFDETDNRPSELKHVPLEIDLDLLFQCPLWQRLWAFQELVLARDIEVQLGKDSICLDSLQSPAHERTTPRLHTFEALRNLRCRPHAPYLAELLYLLRLLRSRDPRDKVFALVGMLARDDRTAIANMVDYRMSTPEVHQNVARMLIGPDMLSINPIEAGAWESTTETWVPDWSVELFDHPLAGGRFNPPQQRLFSAGTTQFGQWAQSNIICNKNEAVRLSLEAKAIIIDIIGFVSLSTNETVAHKCLVGTFPTCPSNTRNSQLCSPINAQRVLLEDRILAKDGLFRRLEAKDDLDQELSRSISTRGNRMDRCFFSTQSNGYIGNGPHQARIGDEIAVLVGADVPHVLRRVSPREIESQESWLELVGEW